MNMAVTGSNGDNETHIGLSKSISYSLYDVYKNEIPIKDQKNPIEYWIPKDASVSIDPYKYIDAINFFNENLSNKSYINGFYVNGFKLSGNNVSVHVQIKPMKSTGYLFLLKFGDNPVANIEYFDEWNIYCPTGKFNIPVYIFQFKF